MKVYKSPVIHKVTPDYHFYSKNSALVITGENFVNIKALTLRFTHNTYTSTIHPIFISPTLLMSSYPSSLEYIPISQSSIPLQINVDVSNNNFEFSNTLLISMYPIPLILEVIPDSAYHDDVDILIKGRFFYNVLTHCMFGDYESPIVSINQNEIVCKTPRHLNPGKEKTRLKLKALSTYSIELFSHKEVYFTYLKLLTILQTNIFPSHGSILGGDIVTITTEEDIAITEEDIVNGRFKVYFCSFEGTEVKKVSSNVITVVSPAIPSLRTCEIKLAFNGKQINLSQIFFYYIEYSISNIKISPTLGPYSGNTLVTVTNEGDYADDLRYICVFDKTKVDAYIIDSHHLTCMSPVHDPGTVSFSIIIGEQYTTLNQYKIEYLYYSQVHILTLSPTLVYIYSSCMIKAKIINMLYDSDYICVRIGLDNIITKEKIKQSNTDPTVIEFTLPVGLKDGEHDFYFSNNCQNFVVYNHFPKLSVINSINIYIDRIEPSYIPFKTQGNFYAIGRGFDIGMKEIGLNLKIKIGDVVLVGRYINDTTIEFDYPDMINNDLNQDYAIFSTVFYYNGCFYLPYMEQIVLYKNLANLNYDEIYIQAFSDDLIIINADNVINLSMLQCKLFLSSESDDFIIQEGVYLNPNSFACHVPKISPGIYEMSFSQNGHDFVSFSDNKRIHILPNVKLFSVKPKLISVQYTGYVYVYGLNFIKRDNIYCMYTASGFDGIVTKGEYMNRFIVKCQVPEFQVLDYAKYDVRISFWNYKTIKFTEEKVTLYIYQYPPNGMYINTAKVNQISFCKEGYACNRRLPVKNLEMFPCQYGYYIPFKGRSGCIPCDDFGHKCNVPTALTSPMACNNQGYICTNQGIDEQQCPRGSLCKSTIIDNPFANSAHEVIVSLPIKSGIGVYCPAGCKQETPCMIGHICPLGSHRDIGIGGCISGHYCPDVTSEPIICPKRRYCPGRGNISPIPCKAGTYNDEEGRSTCKECPIGFICPYDGMYKPEPCPNGYACEKRGLRFPYQFCKPGGVCGNGMKFYFDEKVCFYSRVCDTSTGEYITGSMTGNAYLMKILEYDSEYHLHLCCLGWKKIEQLLKYLDQLYFPSQYSLTKYLDNIEEADLNGYQIALKYTAHQLELGYDEISMYITPHRELISLLIDSMLNSFRSFYPKPCPRKYYCLEGVAVGTPDSDWDYTPKLCLVGYYCPGGSKYIIGAGQCPSGYSCPAGTDIPKLGTGSGSGGGNTTVETGCYPGTFLTSETMESSCLQCPDGYECVEQGTYWPTICKEGYFRTIYDSCMSCPKGTYSYEKGQKDSSQCVPCPPGKICSSTNLNDPSLIKQCDEGLVCDNGSGLISPTNCPSGYFCPSGTSPSTKYDNKCPEGYTCAEGTGSTNKYSQKCPSSYYCPLASKGVTEDDSGTQTYPNLFRCPVGMSTKGSLGKVSILQCKPNTEHFIFLSSSTRSLESLSVSQKDIENFEETATNSEEDILKYYELINSYDLVNLEITKFSTSAQISSTINLKREPIISLSPMITDMGLSPIHTVYKKYPEINNLNYEKHYYSISANSLAVITFDFRHLASPENFFIYGIDWEISFEKYSSNIPLAELEQKEPFLLQIPETYINKTNSKSKVHEFSLYTFEDFILSIDIKIYSGMYSSYFSMFNKTVTIQEVLPKRANLHTDKFFGVIWKEDETFEFPVNLLLINSTLENNFNSINEKKQMNFISYDSNNLDIKNTIEVGINSYQLSSQYWGTSEVLGLPYIPYFSNCKGYGKHISLSALLEQNENCTLIQEKQTIPIYDFSFGVNGKGDNCDIELECIFDEDSSKLSNKKYWFQAKTGDYLFSVSQNPITLEELLNSPESVDVIDVSIENDCSEGEVPGVVEMTINYFQKTPTLKKLIDVSLSLKEPIDPAVIGKENIPYRLQVKYQPYSHTKLMVAFALSSKFYLVLYLIEGAITSLMVLTFYLYHKLMSRTEPRPIFKFWTFLPLILPPAIAGFLIAIIPLMIIFFWIGVITIGNFFFKEIKLFSVYTEDGYELFTPFDFFTYFSNTSTDLPTLRKGRLGTGLFIMGVVLIYYHTNLVVPNEEKLSREKSYDNNKWDFFNWKKLHVYYVDIVLTVINVYYTMLSFCGVWSDNIWYFIYSYKIVGILAENIYEEIFQEQLFISGFGCIFNIVQSLLTFGASDLIDFLNSSFIEQGGALIEKVYIESFTNYLKDHAEEYIAKIKLFIRRVLKYDLELESEKQVKESDDEENDDAIILTDEEEEEEGDYIEGDNDNPEESKEQKEETSINSNSSDKGNPNAIEIEEYFDRYKGFASDLLSYFYNMAFYLVLWFFYDEMKILENYDITKENFVYFYYFTLLTVFFTVTNDILLHNLMEEYDNIQMHDFLDYVQYRYYIRETSWCLSDPIVNFEVEFPVRKMYKLCFSSQYYYLKMHYITGLLCTQLGITTWCLNAFNPFGDTATIPIFITVIFIMKVVHIISSFFAKVMKIWFVYPYDEKEEGLKTTIISKKSIFEKLGINTSIVKKKYEIEPISKENWEKIKFLKEQEEIVEENLRTERLILEVTRKQFVNLNKKWLQNVISEIVTPRTLIQNKDKVINVLKKRYKDKEPDVNLESFRFYSPHQSLEQSYSSEEFRNGFLSEFQTKKKVNEILQIWKRKGALSLKLKKIIQLIILDLKKNKCSVCSSKVSLVSVYKGDILKLFFKYIHDKNDNIDDFDSSQFKLYFLEFGRKEVVTLCSNCLD